MFLLDGAYDERRIVGRGRVSCVEPDGYQVRDKRDIDILSGVGGDNDNPLGVAMG